MSVGNGAQLAGRTAIVTGAGRGIGESIALTLADRGAQVMVVGRASEPLNTTVAAIEERGGTAFAVQADISSSADVSAMVSEAMRRWGHIDILVNNAAIFDEPPFFDLDEKTFQATFAINVTGTFLLSQAVARHMADAGKGSIIHISSIDALGADGPFTAYTATKAAVVSLARTMTMELAPLGIRVNCVAPGFVNTDMVHKTSTPNVLQHMLNDFTRVPMRRLVEPDEIGAAVAFLASDDASAITGINLVVDGGLTSNLFVMETLPEPMIPLGEDD
ncbi:oxidoreductase [Mycobacterium sp. 852013-50091_SCH5140682]|uniref:SDR family NAD(P)-dependent oxidoreductase n=1 Tax=Mycobacterium sp. 852013-50091_SCH5140682 TaxID=1834109 RepID=UPI0007EB74C5|nr:SDR family NAD(P)-dependent oxidoreductase [Mycobacterium sp. 852013-50091_SCH5140682]OBC15392.1 oxidoreductase [Mycobacterium sp. 852013-50091_SCH5140682]